MKPAFFLLIPLLWGSLGASEIHNWISSSSSKKSPVLAVYQNPLAYQELRENMRLYLQEAYLKRFEETFRIKAVSAKEFSAQFPDFEERSYGDEVAFYFFDTDTMALFIELYSARHLPGYALFLRYEEAQKEYRAYLSGEPERQGSLYWPHRAFISGNYPLTRKLLGRVEPSKLSKKERAAWYKLQEMLYRREREKKD